MSANRNLTVRLGAELRIALADEARRRVTTPEAVMITALREHLYAEPKSAPSTRVASSHALR